jgi:hypothetical protein
MIPKLIMNEHGGQKWIYIAAPNVSDQLAALEEDLRRHTELMHAHTEKMQRIDRQVESRQVQLRGNPVDKQPRAATAAAKQILSMQEVKPSPIKVASKIPQRIRVVCAAPGPLQGYATETAACPTGHLMNKHPNRDIDSYNLPSSLLRQQLRAGQQRIHQMDRQLSSRGSVPHTSRNLKTEVPQNRKNCEDFSSALPMAGLAMFRTGTTPRRSGLGNNFRAC